MLTRPYANKHMTTLLYLEDFAMYTFTAKIKGIKEQEGKMVVFLDQTLFYPQGGGQPYDQGVIENERGKFMVEEVRFIDSEVWHAGHFEKGTFVVNEEVRGHIDKDRRLLNARIHSAGHLVDKAIDELGLGWTPGKGYHFPNGPYDEYFGSLEGVDTEKVKADTEKLCNGYIAEGGKTEVIFMTREEMKATCRYAPDFPTQKGEQARIVVHGGFYMPCGGTPVTDMAEIGRITIRKIKKEGDNVRIGYNILKQ